MPVVQLDQFTVPQLGDDRWVLAPWSSTRPPFQILVRCSQSPAPPLRNSTYGFVGIYQVAQGRLLMFNNQVLLAGADNGAVWGTVIPPNPNLLVNLPQSPARYPWGVIFSIHRWMQPVTITLEEIVN